MRGRERLKIYFLQSVPTRPGLEHSEKNSKKIQKNKKHHSSFISSQTGSGHAEKEKKNRYDLLLPESG